MDLGPHTSYILTAYAGVTLVSLGLIVWVIMQNRSVKARLAALEAQGVRRRSAGPTA
ncbi:MAG: heme exporter protein CcmD [Hyphomicrobiales bacterium]|nr:MAG: heme exporter protein CcmD [Hyphomicrobiales bacterium]